jgi:hypothetical protein
MNMNFDVDYPETFPLYFAFTLQKYYSSSHYVF